MEGITDSQSERERERAAIRSFVPSWQRFRLHWARIYFGRVGRRQAFEGECSIAARFFFLFSFSFSLVLLVCVLEPSLRNCTCQSATIRLRAREGSEAEGGEQPRRPSPWREEGRRPPSSRCEAALGQGGKKDGSKSEGAVDSSRKDCTAATLSRPIL